MATATKTTPSAELAKLTEQRAKAHAKVRAIKADRAGYEAETEALRATATAHRHEHPDQYQGGDFRPKPNTEAAKLSTQTRARMESPNPFDEDLAKAVAAFHAAGDAEDAFRRSRMADLIAEHDPALDEAIESIRSGLRSVIEGAELYNEVVEHVRALVIDCPGLTGQDLVHDLRPEELIKLATPALEGEIRAPGISDLAVWKLSNG